MRNGAKNQELFILHFMPLFYTLLILYKKFFKIEVKLILGNKTFDIKNNSAFRPWLKIRTRMDPKVKIKIAKKFIFSGLNGLKIQKL